MKKGLIAFLVLLAFVPTGLYALQIHAKQTTGIVETKQFLIEQQALTVIEQDFEETFWRYTKHHDSLDAWINQMQSKGIHVWYGNTQGNLKQTRKKPPTEKPWITTAKSTQGNRIVSIPGDEYYAIGATITIGNSTGIYLIPAGCKHEYS